MNEVFEMTDVTVYSTPTCPFCIKLKAWLKDKGVGFEDIDVSQDQAKAQEMIRKSGQMGVPQIEIGGKIIVGFDPDAIEAELASAGAKDAGDRKDSDDTGLKEAACAGLGWNRGGPLQKASWAASQMCPGGLPRRLTRRLPGATFTC